MSRESTNSTNSPLIDLLSSEDGSKVVAELLKKRAEEIGPSPLHALAASKGGRELLMQLMTENVNFMEALFTPLIEDSKPTQKPLASTLNTSVLTQEGRNQLSDAKTDNTQNDVTAGNP